VRVILSIWEETWPWHKACHLLRTLSSSNLTSTGSCFVCIIFQVQSPAPILFTVFDPLTVRHEYSDTGCNTTSWLAAWFFGYLTVIFQLQRLYSVQMRVWSWTVSKGFGGIPLWPIRRYYSSIHLQSVRWRRSSSRTIGNWAKIRTQYIPSTASPMFGITLLGCETV
jgi:hypothetical protein